MQRAAIYARFSSENQRDESIDAQLRLGREYAERNGYLVVKEYCEYALTGKTDDRKEFQAMLSDAKSKMFDVVITDVVDRFSRDKVDSGMHKRFLRRKCNIRVEYASQRIDDSPEGRLLEGVLEDVAQFHSGNLARETMKGLTENALKGWHTGGKPAFGFSLVDIPGTKTPKHPMPSRRLIVNESEAPVIRRIFETYEAGGTYGDIMAATHDDMIRLHGRPLGKNSIHDILRNEKYSGVVVYKRGTHKEHRHVRDDAIRVLVADLAIVPREMWERSQTRMDKRKNDNGECARGRAKEVYLLSGLIRCGKCESAMVGVSGYGRDKIRHPYYVCGKKQRSHECDLKTIRKDTVELMVIEDMKADLFSAAGKTRLKEKFATHLAERPNQVKAETAHAKRELAGLDTKINNIVMAVANGHSSPALLDQLSKFEQQREVLRSQLAGLELKEKNPATIGQVMDDIEAAEKKLNSGDPKDAKQVIQTFVSKVIVDDENIRTVYKISIGNEKPPSDGEGGSYTTGSAKAHPIASKTYHKRKRFNNM